MATLLSFSFIGLIALVLLCLTIRDDIFKSRGK
jgi:hypothetical protein